MSIKIVARRGSIEYHEEKIVQSVESGVMWLATGDENGTWENFLYPAPGGGGIILINDCLVRGVGSDGGAINFEFWSDFHVRSD